MSDDRLDKLIETGARALRRDLAEPARSSAFAENTVRAVLEAIDSEHGLYDPEDVRRLVEAAANAGGLLLALLMADARFEKSAHHPDVLKEMQDAEASVRRALAPFTEREGETSG